MVRVAVLVDVVLHEHVSSVVLASVVIQEHLLVAIQVLVLLQAGTRYPSNVVVHEQLLLLLVHVDLVQEVATIVLIVPAISRLRVLLLLLVVVHLLLLLPILVILLIVVVVEHLVAHSLVVVVVLHEQVVCEVVPAHVRVAPGCRAVLRRLLLLVQL